MAKIYLIIAFIFVANAFAFAQDQPNAKRDTVKHLQEATIRGYLIEQPVLSVPASVSLISPDQLKVQPENSLVPTLNTVPGVRMEERSPGSYRLSIRGSLIRSPFGVRDVKVYFDDIPLTDGGGNTYLNAIDINSIQGLEILKGPDGSLFGANSGGVVLLRPVNKNADSNFIAAKLNSGSFGLFHENVALQNTSGNNLLNLSQAYETYGGYRQNSYMQRKYFQGVDQWKYAKHDELKFLGFYSDMSYETPGGLTLAQFNADPHQARLATPTIPGAIQQHAGIYQKILFGGVTNDAQISDRLKNVLSVFGTYVDFANPFITDYENRYEGTYGLRTYFELSGKPDSVINWKVNLGLEWQQTNSDINNYGNRSGVRDTAQTLDKINTNQHFFFARYLADIDKRLHVEAAMSLNFYDYQFRNVFPNEETEFTKRHFTPQLMPRIALSYQVTNDFIWRASVSRGYSTPTTAEIRPTDHAINTGLQAEDGINYETGFRLRNADESMFLDASVYYYDLHNAIIPQEDVNGNTFYTNAGGTSQPGLEIYFTDWLIRQNNVDFIRGLQFNQSVTLNKFKFTNYHTATGNFTGNQLTGVPNQVFVSSLQVKFPARLYMFAEYNYTARIPLKDDNTVYAAHYNLVQAKAGWETLIGRNSRLGIYAGIDNLLNEKYSLGNDLNAVGNRFYNAAAPRNYYMGLSVKF